MSVSRSTETGGLAGVRGGYAPLDSGLLVPQANLPGSTVVDAFGVSTTGVKEIRFPTAKVTAVSTGIISVKFLPGASVTALGTYGDECNTTTVDAAWTLRNIPSFTGDGTSYPLVMDAQGDALTRAITDPAADFEIMCHLTGLANGGGMLGLCALDGSGNGVGYSFYNDGNTYTWGISAYAYSGTGGSNGSQGQMADHWLHLRRTGSAWSGRYSNDGNFWSGWSSTSTDSRTITKIGILRAYTNGGTHSPSLERFVYGTTSIVFP